MRTILIALILTLCTGALLAGSANATPLSLDLPEIVASNPPTTEPGSYDPYVGLGDLNTKAVPVCCCSFGFCEDTPNAPCTGGPPVCRCNSAGYVCILP